MKISSQYPVLMTDNVKKSREFYVKHFDFSITFENEWYVSLINSESGNELALIDKTHETIPEKFRKSVKGMILNMEVEDVETLYQKLIIEEQLPLHLELKDERFGQRHFITSGPDNVLIDVITNIPPDQEFSQHYNM